MDLWIVAGILITGLGLLLSFRHLNRPLQCPECGETTEPIARDCESRFAPVVEIAFWCPRCARVVARRFLSMAFD